MSGGVELKVSGANTFGALSARLKEAGDKGLRRELFKALNRSTKPLKEAARASALAELPKAGGLAEKVAASQFSTRTRAGANPSVRIVVKGLSVSNLRRIDRGSIRHPVYGNRDVWVDQKVDAGWFTKPMEGGTSLVRIEIEKAMSEIARRLQ